MKKTMLIVALLLSMGAFAQHDMHNIPAQKKTATKEVYTCPMHPQVQKSGPGSCPICGMTLEKKTVKKAAAKPATQKKPASATSKAATAKRLDGDTTNMNELMRDMKDMMHDMHGMMSDMKDMMHTMKDGHMHGDSTTMNRQMGSEAGQMMSKSVYTCVMHPEVQQDKPGKCPKCGMTLVKKTVQVPAPKKDGNGMDMQHNMHDMHNMEGMNGMNGNNGMNRPVEGVDPFNQIPSRLNMAPGKTVRYDLYVKDTVVNYTGKQRHAIAINGSIPGPTLYFNEGDTAEIYMHNLLNEETSLHWHGVILPNRYDGVPFLTTAPVHPSETHLYKFKVAQNGTYWYHSHNGLQEQIGMYGALIFKPREAPDVAQSSTLMTLDTAGAKMENHSSSSAKGPDAGLKHETVVLSEWSDEDPTQTQRRFRTGNDWFSIKKGSTQSYAEAIREGRFKTKLVNEWKRMKAMDVSDDWYPKFLLNGQTESSATGYKAGDKVRLHIANAGASSYFWLGYGGGKITVVGNDGNDVVPVDVDRLIIAPAETYDVVVTLPENKSYEFRATSEDRIGASSLWLGNGAKMPAPKLPRLKYFEGMQMMNDMMNVDGTMKDMGMNMSLQKMDMNMVMYPEITGGTGDDDGSGTNKGGGQQMAMPGMDHSMHNMSMPSGGDIVTLNYDMLRSPVKTALPDGPTKTLHFTLTGNMNRYLWTMDNKTVTESDRILINKGENVRMVITNNSMMRHPMHLHGHDFRVLNSAGEYSPQKNVIDIMPMETDTIEFAANQDGNWFFHCHILYHMMAGMGRVFTYANSPVNPELPNAEEAYRKFRNNKDQNMKHLMARIGLESNGSDGEAMLTSNRYALNGLWHLGTSPHHGYEGEIAFGRYLGTNQWWLPYVGFDYHHKVEEGNPKEASDYRNLFGQVSNKNNRSTFTAGIQYITPGLFLADARVDGNGKLRFQLSREDIPVTARLRFNIMGNTDKEYMAGFRYVVSKWLALSTHYDSDMGLGAGVTVTY